MRKLPSSNPTTAWMLPGNILIVVAWAIPHSAAVRVSRGLPSAIENTRTSPASAGSPDFATAWASKSQATTPVSSAPRQVATVFSTPCEDGDPEDDDAAGAAIAEDARSDVSRAG